ncbi:MAG TPA: inositol monophosphatase family protein, partial [Candidatus Caenarcaniphilales bacterium]|nr:inositol monophosphatase family protein [Candidatus Caenarcaniphilales bacterium]
ERLERIVRKSEHDVVTEVDELSEQLILSTIREAYPTDAFLAEESGHTRTGEPMGGNDGTDGPDRTDGGLPDRLWVIDPLDGTVNYANGIPIFCVSIGLVEAGRPVLGVVHDPVRDETYSALAGDGARLDGVSIRLPEKEKLSDLVLSLALPARGWAVRDRRIRRGIRVARSLGSAALSLTYVANGRFDGFVQSGGLSLWDICAAGLIAREGGARITAVDGGEWFDVTRTAKSIGIVAAASTHHQTLLESLA